MKISQKCTAVLLSSALILQPSMAMATSNSDTEENTLETISKDEVNITEQSNDTLTTTPSAVKVVTTSSSVKINMLQNKIDEALAKVEQEQENGVVFATEKLSDLYLEASEVDDTLSNFQLTIDAARQLIETGSTNEEAIQIAYDAIDVSYDRLRRIEKYDSFSGTEGEVWKDTNGVKIQAHGGQVQWLEHEGKWWWYGEDKTKGYRSNGISAYSSDDLYNWEFQGYVMRTVSSREELDTDPYFSELYKDYTFKEKDNVYLCINDSTSVIERPKMIYNKKTGKYVLWFHADGPTVEAPNSNYAAAAAGVAISDSPNGPFKFIDRYRLDVCPKEDKTGAWYESSAGFARDMNLWIDDDDTAYIIYSSEENRTMFISRLNDEYTNLNVDPENSVKGKDFVRLFPGAQREAPALFKYNNKYYMITSGATGWDPNAARYWVADNILGEWTDMGDPCIDDTDKKTFYTQSTNVIPVDADAGKFIYMGDRWKSSDLGDSRYVWLPLEFDSNGKLLIKSYTDWTLEDLNNKYSIKVNTPLKDVYTSSLDLPSTVNIAVYDDVEGKWVNKDTKVTWDIPELIPTVQTTITGKLDEINREINVDLIKIPNNLKYYIDCGNTQSNTFNLINESVDLKNNNAWDQAYTEGNWGYSSKIGTDIDVYGTSSTGSFDTGYWAHSGKTIDYVLPLEAGNYNLFAGFNEWWNTSRTMGISISYKDANGQIVKQNLGTFTNKGQKTVDYSFNLPVDSDVTVSVYKPNTTNPDVVLSWLAIQFDNVEIPSDENPNMKDLYTGVDELPKTLNIKAFENNEWVSKNTTVTWDVSTLNSMEQAKVTGTLAYNDKKIQAEVVNIPKNLQYYIDCGATNGSILYDAINGKVQLINNEKVDQAYEEGSWGYVGEIGTDIGYKNPDSTDAYISGYWAYKDKNIEYTIPLKAGNYNLFAGFNEWWSANRTMNVSVSYKDKEGEVVKQELGTIINNGKKLVDYEFELTEDADVTISVYKPNTGNPDVILSWLAIEEIKEDQEIPTDPEKPTDPTDPEKPIDPEKPVDPTDPEKPIDPEAPTMYKINVQAGAHGSISPNGEVNVIENKDQTFTITPDSGYKISDVKVDGVSVGTVSSYSFKNVTSAHTISATFKSKKSSSKSSSSSTNNVSDTVTTNTDEASIISAINSGTTNTIVIDINNSNSENSMDINSGMSSNTPLISESILKLLKANEDKTLVIKIANSSIEIKSKNGQIQFTENGTIITGFKSVGKAEYYLDKNGIMKTGWAQTLDNNWYYLNPMTGIKATNWIKDTNGKWYYLDSTSGVMKTGWVKDNGTWYYLNNDGAMKTGWFKDNDGKWCYLNTNGVMATNVTIDGYYIDSNGVWSN